MALADAEVPDKRGLSTQKSIIFLGDLERCVYGVGVGRQRGREIETDKDKGTQREKWSKQSLQD